MTYKYIHWVLIDTIQRLGPFLSDPQGEPLERNQAIISILQCLDIIDEILQPIRDFAEVRQADPEIFISLQPRPGLFRRKMKQFIENAPIFIGFLSLLVIHLLFIIYLI